MTRTVRLGLWGALALPWLFIWQGLDFTDQGYLLTGYRCFFRHPEVTEDSGHMWLTNLIGASWDALFGSLGVVGMRALWALCMSLGMLLGFRLVRSISSERTAAFVAPVASAFLSDRRETWFSYNTLSSLLFAGAAACLLKGIAARRRPWLVAAGALIGLGPFARFPNLLAGGLLSAVALAAWLDAKRRPDLVRDLGATLLGMLAGVMAMLAFIYLRGDFPLYLRGVRSLFAPSMQQAGYGPSSLLSNFLIDEAKALGFGLGVCLAGVGVARLLAAIPEWARWGVVALACGLGIFGLARPGEPWRWVVPGTAYFVLAAISCGFSRASVEMRVAAWLVLIVLVIAPLGSNNGLKNAHMGLWLALPVMLGSIEALGPKLLAGQGPKLLLMAALVLCGEAVYQISTYTYRDAPRGNLHVAVDDPQLRFQYTTQARARVVKGVLDALATRVSPGDYLLAYEGTPLLQYLTKTRPYLNRPWLMGWERGAVVEQLAAEAPRRTGCLPVAVVTLKNTRSFEWPERPRRLDQRQPQLGVRRALKAFLREHDYKRTWQNGFFEILEPPPANRSKCR